MRGRPVRRRCAACLALDADVLVLQEVWRPHGGPRFVDEIAERTGAVVHEVVFMSDHNPARPAPPAVRRRDRPGTCGLAVLSRLPVCDVHRRCRCPRPPATSSSSRHSARRHGRRSTDARSRSAGMHASHRLWGSLPQVRTLDRALAARGLPTVHRRRLQHVGPAVGARRCRDRRRAVRGRTWPARRPAQPDRPHLDRRPASTVARRRASGRRPARTTGPVRARLRRAVDTRRSSRGSASEEEHRWRTRYAAWSPGARASR